MWVSLSGLVWPTGSIRGDNPFGGFSLGVGAFGHRPLPVYDGLCRLRHC